MKELEERANRIRKAEHLNAAKASQFTSAYHEALALVHAQQEALKEANEENKRLSKRNYEDHRVESYVEDAENTIRNLEQELKEAKERIRGLEEGLKFYINPSPNYKVPLKKGK